MAALRRNVSEKTQLILGRDAPLAMHLKNESSLASPPPLAFLSGWCLSTLRRSANERSVSFRTSKSDDPGARTSLLDLLVGRHVAKGLKTENGVVVLRLRAKAKRELAPPSPKPDSRVPSTASGRSRAATCPPARRRARCPRHPPQRRFRRSRGAPRAAPRRPRRTSAGAAHGVRAS